MYQKSANSEVRSTSRASARGGLAAGRWASALLFLIFGVAASTASAVTIEPGAVSNIGGPAPGNCTSSNSSCAPVASSIALGEPDAVPGNVGACVRGGQGVFGLSSHNGADRSCGKGQSAVAADASNVEVPLPATLWLFASGLMGFVGLSNRKRP